MYDRYVMKARLAPVVLAAAPAIVLVGVGVLGRVQQGSIVAVIIGSLSIVASGFARDRGLAIQPALWSTWGGAPTTRRLRWSGSNNIDNVRTLHRQLALVTGRALPDAQHEQANPSDADRQYESAVSTLRGHSRSRREFPLVFAENAEYGFRRNTLALRPTALGVAAAVFCVSFAMLISGYFHDDADAKHFYAAAAAAVAAMTLWWRIATPDWVRSSAELYADRLFEALALISQGAERADAISSR